MIEVTVKEDRIFIGERFSVSFRRTLRIPDDGRLYPLPPSLGAFPIFKVSDYAGLLPQTWVQRGGVFIPMYQREALWLSFRGARQKPNAVKVGAGRINAVSGEPWDARLHDDPQDYLVIPDQPWLDGINAGNAFVRQFIAIPLGHGYTVESQVGGGEEWGGIQILVFEPKEGMFPDKPLPSPSPAEALWALADVPDSAEMGIGAGGMMRQKIYPDPYGLQTWDQNARGSVYVHLINSEQFYAWLGIEPPPTPIDARMYTEYGFPWFDLYDEPRGDLTAPESLAGVKTVRQIGQEKGDDTSPDVQSVTVDESQIQRIVPPDSDED